MQPAFMLNVQSNRRMDWMTIRECRGGRTKKQEAKARRGEAWAPRARCGGAVLKGLATS